MGQYFEKIEGEAMHRGLEWTVYKFYFLVILK
jgi:hypothetical protein